jgi:hypothetical protein
MGGNMTIPVADIVPATAIKVLIALIKLPPVPESETLKQIEALYAASGKTASDYLRRIAESKRAIAAINSMEDSAEKELKLQKEMTLYQKHFDNAGYLFCKAAGTETGKDRVAALVGYAVCLKTNGHDRAADDEKSQALLELNKLKVAANSEKEKKYGWFFPLMFVAVPALLAFISLWLIFLAPVLLFTRWISVDSHNEDIKKNKKAIEDIEMQLKSAFSN